MSFDIKKKSTGSACSNTDAYAPLNLKQKLIRFAVSIGPGIFIVGYIIGTGSVTSMASSGASYGMSMTWALALSCLFNYIMIVCVSRCTIASGQTIIFCIKKHFGRPVAIFIIFGLMLTVVTSVIGVTAVASDVFREFSKIFTPGNRGIHPIISTTFFIAILYYLFWFGRHKFFLKAMGVVVAIMGVSFFFSMFLVVPSMTEILTGLIPRVPTGAGAHLILAALVGTTLAGVCIVSRSYVISEQGWNLNDLKIENRDAVISSIVTFAISAAIIACAAGTMFPRHIAVNEAIDMVATLEPIAGKFALSIFVCGILAAALSSLFSGYVLGPWLVCDYLNIPRKMDRPIIRIAVLLVAIIGFTVPVFGGKPVIIMIASQAINTITMPFLVVLVFLILNRKKIIGNYKNPLWLNVGLGTTFLFTVFMSYAGLVGLADFVLNR